MKEISKRLVSLLLAIVMICGIVPMTALAAETEDHNHIYSEGICTGCGETILQPEWEQGTIAAANGLEKDYANVIRTVDYLRLSDYVGMTLNAEHYITYFVYDANYNYLGNGKADLTANFLLSGQGISTHEMLIRYPEGEYFKLALWRGKNCEMTLDMLDGADLKFLDATQGSVFWEMGSIYAASGIAFVREQVIRSVNYLPIEDYAGVTVADGYAVSFLAYDDDLNYLGNGNPQKSGYFIPGRITMQEIVNQYPETKYIRLLLIEDPIADITMDAVELSEIRIYRAGENVPEKTYSYQGMESSFEVDFVNGLLDVKKGSYHVTDSGFVTSRTLPLEHISKITWEDDYAVLWGTYNAQNEYLGSCVSYLTSGKITKEDILAVYGEACYIALSVKPVFKNNQELAEMVKKSGLAIHRDLSSTGAVVHDTVMTAQTSQDGAIHNNTLFLFNAKGDCTIFNVKSKEKLGSFTLDKVDILKPHANSVCFSEVYYEQGDPFPLLYVNIYNNYWTTSDPKEGTCCVYRIFEENGTYSTKLVQVLKIGFTDDYTLWNSAECNDYHYYLPYGNFIVDTDENKLWAFVLRNADNQTRFFQFDLPDMSEGVYSESYGCNLVTLEISDIEDMFDLEHFEILQGCTYAEGKIYSVNGLGTKSKYNPFAELKVIDLRSKSVVAVVDFSTLGFSLEPEMISFNVEGDKQLYYLSIDGTLRRLRFIDEITNSASVDRDNEHSYENGTCTGCGAVQPGPIITQQPVNGEAKLGDRYCVTVEAEGEDLTYQWYGRNAGSKKWFKSSVRDNTYDDIMTKARADREIYCVIKDKFGNSVTTETVKLVRVPVKLEIISQPTDSSVHFGEEFCATVEAKGDGLKYQWYYRNKGSEKWRKSGVHDNTYDDIMNKSRNGREIYCVITDQWGNSVTTNTVKLIAVPKVKLKLLDVTYDAAARGNRYCVTVKAEGDELKYQWYGRNAGSKNWFKSSVKDNTYDDVMTKTRANREVYCVITDSCGNKIATDVVVLTVEK